MRRRGALLLSTGLALLLTAPAAATNPSPGGGGWTRLVLEANGRRLAAALRDGGAGDGILTVVIEGDGAAHDRHGRPSADPTPADPTGWRLARAWPEEQAVAWLGRACQFVRDPACAPADWTAERFSEAQLDVADAAIDALKARAGARRVRLVGWSGGGTMAALLAGRRRDVAGLVTVAAPLDLAAWTTWHGLSPLAGPDPARRPPPEVPQLHLIGAFDPIVPPRLAGPVARRFGGTVIVRRARHACCWAGAIPQMTAVGR
jgi:dienelactone hydrolase